MNPQFRNPPPGGLDPATYDDPVTIPAADIAENPYWKRDMRRRYPRLSTVTQADAVALLEVGSAAAPKQELIGEAGSKQLVAAHEEGAKGLAIAFEKNTGLAKDVLGAGGMPPLPGGLHISETGSKRYELEKEQSYSTEYVQATSFVHEEQMLTFSQLPLQDVRVSYCRSACWNVWRTIEVPVNTTTAFSLSDAMSKPISIRICLLLKPLCPRLQCVAVSHYVHSLLAIRVLLRELPHVYLESASLRQALGLASPAARLLHFVARSHFTTRSCIFYPTSAIPTVMESGKSQTLQDPDTLNFIYACSVCGVTFADIHESHNETVQGLSDGINPKERLVTKLYLSGCSHVFCGKHIEGGG